MNLQQVQALVDGVDEAEPAGEGMNERRCRRWRCRGCGRRSRSGCWLAVIMGWQQPRRSFLSSRRWMRRLRSASFRRMLGFTRNPSGRLVLEKADTSFNTGNAQGFRVSPIIRPSKVGDFACLRTSGCASFTWVTFPLGAMLSRPAFRTFPSSKPPRKHVALARPHAFAELGRDEVPRPARESMAHPHNS